MVAKKYVRHQLRLIKRSLLSAPIDTPQSRPPIRWAKYTKTSRSIYIEFKLVEHDFFYQQARGQHAKRKFNLSRTATRKKGRRQIPCRVYVCIYMRNASGMQKEKASSKRKAKKERKKKEHRNRTGLCTERDIFVVKNECVYVLVSRRRADWWCVFGRHEANFKLCLSCLSQVGGLGVVVLLNANRVIYGSILNAMCMFSLFNDFKHIRTHANHIIVYPKAPYGFIWNASCCALLLLAPYILVCLFWI